MSKLDTVINNNYDGTIQLDIILHNIGLQSIVYHRVLE